METHMTEEILMRRPAVEAKTGLSRSALYAMMAEGRFPRPVRISAKAVAWRASEVAAWMASREAA